MRKEVHEKGDGRLTETMPCSCWHHRALVDSQHLQMYTALGGTQHWVDSQHLQNSERYNHSQTPIIIITQYKLVAHSVHKLNILI